MGVGNKVFAAPNNAVNVFWPGLRRFIGVSELSRFRSVSLERVVAACRMSLCQRFSMKSVSVIRYELLAAESGTEESCRGAGRDRAVESACQRRGFFVLRTIHFCE